MFAVLGMREDLQVVDRAANRIHPRVAEQGLPSIIDLDEADFGAPRDGDTKRSPRVTLDLL